MRRPIFIALDMSESKALTLVKQLLPLGLTHYKVGMSLFYEAGLPFINTLQALGATVFVDLKLHDIPSTVARTTRTLVRHGVGFLNVHTLGGAHMMEAAVEAARDEAQQQRFDTPTVIGVTLLTSHTQATITRELRIPHQLEHQVDHLAALAKQAGLDGVVCSAWEAERVRECCGSEFLRVTPGIRVVGDETGDQSRIATPSKAFALGATHLVIGRSVYDSIDPVKTAQSLLATVEP